MALIKWLPELDQADLTIAGGKGANLGAMIQHGLPVPNGFVLLTAAYQDFVQANGHQEAIKQIVDRLGPDTDSQRIEEASDALQALLGQSPMSERIALAIKMAYQKLGQQAVAVRSSATAEDLPDTSFAGQQDTYLHVLGATEVCQAVQKCWASLWNARAIAYRLRNHIAHESLALAVVVQGMVDADKAGILFTANPVNGRRDQMIINAAWGLGEAIVSGEVNPDQWVIDQTGSIIEEKIACKTVMTIRGDHGTITETVPEDEQNQPSLTQAEVKELATLGQRLARYFGSPQDIEWAWSNGQLYLLQSRPITSLFPMPEPLPQPEDGFRVYACLNTGQGLVEPFTPMGLDLLRTNLVSFYSIMTGIEFTRNPWWFKSGAGRIYLDVTELLRNPKRWPMIPSRLGNKDQIMADALYQLVYRHAEELTSKKPPRVKIPWGLVRLLLGKVMWAWRHPEAVPGEMVRMADQTMERLEAGCQRLQGVEERLRFIENSMAEVANLLLWECATIAPGILAVDMATRRVQQWLGDPAPVLATLRSLPHNPTTEMGMALWRLSRILLAEGVTPCADHPAVQAFLKQYGHRANREIDVGQPRWVEDPTHILNVLHIYMGAEQTLDNEQQFMTNRAKAEADTKALVAEVRRKRGAVQARMLHSWLSTAQELAGLRERPKFDWMRTTALYRRVLQGAGRELVAEGRLESPNDIFFLSFKELRSNRDLRSAVERHRCEYERELKRRSIPRVMTSTGESIYTAAEQASSNTLNGTPVSPGSYEGIARVIHDPVGARLEPGEILIASSTDPAWTPLFLTAGALVMEVGGTIAHGAVVAREYGIPAVAGVSNATTRIHTGQRIRVNGSTGHVELL